MDRQHRFATAAVVALGCLALIACASGGEDFAYRSVPEGGVSGEVVQVDAEAQQLRVRTAEDAAFTVAYTEDTYVYFERERSPVTALEPGDEVVIHLSRDREGELHADWVDVQRSLQQRQRTLAPNEVEGEVVQLQPDRQELLLSTEGGVIRLAYGADTPVTYREETYQIANLEPGDLVRVQMAEGAGDVRRAASVEVVRSVQERSGGGGAVERQEPRTVVGRIDWIDPRAGEFTLQTREGMLRVVVRASADPMTLRAFQQLRRGQTVRLLVQPIGAGMAELLRFQ